MQRHSVSRVKSGTIRFQNDAVYVMKKDVTFDTPFSRTPSIVVSLNDKPHYPENITLVATASTTGASIYLYNSSTVYGSGDLTVSWIAHV